MKSQELKIGNFIFDDEGNLVRITGFKPFGHSTRCDEEEGCDLLIDIYSQDGQIRKNYEVDINYGKPIPLDEEWLLKFGFYKCSYDFLFWEHPKLKSVDFAGINWADEDFPEYQFLNVSINENIIQINYIHELQNLYFVLTNEELTFK
jgi:hypothetical protein